MAKSAAKKAGRIAKQSGTTRMLIARDSRTGRFETVMQAAERSGLLKDKSSRIAGRVSAALVRQAKKHTGIETDTDLIAFALANIALEDNFAETFKAARGKVDAGLKLGF